MDLIIAGQRNGLKIYYEDDKCIAFENTNLGIEAHFNVVLKQKNVTGLADANSEDVGHLMFIASKVAKDIGLEEGYRVVLD